MNSISDRVLRLRNEKKFSRKDLAELAEVSQPTIYNIENGKTDNITLSVGKKIAKALGISFGELFEIEVPKTSDDTDNFKEEISQLKQTISAKDELIKIQSEAIELYKQGYLEAKKVYTLSERISSIAKDELTKINAEKTSVTEFERIVAKRVYNELPEIEKKIEDENSDYFFSGQQQKK